MQALVLGGTSFVGRAIVEELLARGHDVTLFSRGKTGAELFPQAQRRTGDRDAGDYAQLADGRWEVVVDVSGYVPRHVQQAMDAVGDVRRYLFISTGSVYDRTQAPDLMDEDAPRLAPERGTEEITMATAAAPRCRDARTSPCRSSTRATSPGWSCSCSRTTGRASTTRSGRPSR